MDPKPDFEKSVINFKCQEYCHCPVRLRAISATMVAKACSLPFSYYLVNGEYFATAL